jgi:hypothetical protein
LTAISEEMVKRGAVAMDDAIAKWQPGTGQRIKEVAARACLTAALSDQAETIRACVRSTLIGFQTELGDRNIEFICDQIARKATMGEMAGGWRDISTAQRSSAVELMVYDAHSGITHQAIWKEPFGGFATGGWYDMPFTGEGRRLARPTHWQPLLAPPTSSTAGEVG